MSSSMYCIPVSVRRIYFQKLFLYTKTNAVLEDTTFVTHRLEGYPSAKWDATVSQLEILLTMQSFLME